MVWLSSPPVCPNKKALVVTIEGVQSRDFGVRTWTLVCKSCCSFVLSTYRTMKSEVRAPPKAVLASWNKLTKDISTVAPMYHQNARTERLAGGRPADFGQDFGQEWVIRVTTSYVFWHPRVVFACINNANCAFALDLALILAPEISSLSLFSAQNHNNGAVATRPVPIFSTKP